MADAVARPYRAYRVIELPGAATLLFGKTFADLGADVIKVEPPGGDPARSLPPLYETESGVHGLYWAAYSLGKRSITVDLSDQSGRDLIRALVATADVVVESFHPGTLQELGLGYEALRQINPALLLTSITSFGQTGPFAGWLGSDLVHLAMSGYLNMTGLPDDAPIKPSAPYQTYLHGSMQAVTATLLALRQRRRTGLGTHVDQAMRDTGMWMLTHTYQFWDMLGINLKRQGAARDMGGALRMPSVWPAADGYVVWLMRTGHLGAERQRQLVAWMAESDMAPEWLHSIDWDTFDLVSAGPEMQQRLTETFAAFLATKTKAELFEWCLPRGMMLAPIQTLEDVATDVQLRERGAWRSVDGAVPGRSVTVPGGPVRLSEASWEPYGPSPSPGEHNDAVTLGLLGLARGGQASQSLSGAAASRAGR